VPVNSCILVADRTAARNFPRGEIALSFCESCGFIGNTRFDPELIEYSESYEETQGFSPRFRAFAEDLARSLVEELDLRDREILEIGCGKGEFLALLCELGPNRGVGIDPGYVEGRLASPANDRMTFIRDFYDERYAELTGDLICCRHTLEHIGPISDFLRLVRGSAERRSGSHVFFEVPDVVRVLRETAFWDIYYEHCSYFSAGSLERTFAAHDFGVTALEVAFEGQYLLMTGQAGRAAGVTNRGEPVSELRGHVEAFVAGYRHQVEHWLAELERVRGRRPVVWGSGSKAVAWLTTLGVDDEVEYVVDINPYKQGKFMAGTGHEIVAPAFLADYRPEAVIIMNPVYREEIAGELDRLGVSAELLSV
jgi:SAM-dependent methyltransferase